MYINTHVFLHIWTHDSKSGIISFPFSRHFLIATSFSWLAILIALQITKNRCDWLPDVSDRHRTQSWPQTCWCTSFETSSIAIWLDRPQYLGYSKQGHIWIRTTIITNRFHLYTTFSCWQNGKGSQTTERLSSGTHDRSVPYPTHDHNQERLVSRPSTTEAWMDEATAPSITSTLCSTRSYLS